MKTFDTLIVFFAFIFLASCNHTRKNGKRIAAKVSVAPDSVILNNNVAIIDTIKHYDSLQIEFGNKLNVPYDSINNLKLYSFIKENLGKKCLNNKKVNYNCESFLTELFSQVYDIAIPLTIKEQVNYNPFELFKNTSYLTTGDVLFFNNNFKYPDKVTHSGFFLQNGFMLIASYNEGIVITKLNNGYWSKHFVAAARIIKK